VPPEVTVRPWQPVSDELMAKLAERASAVSENRITEREQNVSAKLEVQVDWRPDNGPRETIMFEMALGTKINSLAHQLEAHLGEPVNLKKICNMSTILADGHDTVYEATPANSKSLKDYLAAQEKSEHQEMWHHIVQGEDLPPEGCFLDLFCGCFKKERYQQKRAQEPDT
jgi:hypothetical protein